MIILKPAISCFNDCCEIRSHSYLPLPICIRIHPGSTLLPPSLSLSLSLSRSTELLRRFHLDPIPSIAILLQCLFELSQGNKVLKLLFIFIPKLAEPLIDGFTLGMSHLKLTSYAVSSNGQNTRGTVTSRDTNWLTKLISIKFYSTFQPTFLLES